MSASAGRLQELDGLRAIAITLVMLLHFQLLGLGWVGVQVFFVLSGFVITRVLLRTADWPAGAYFARFYRNRALRILPVYFAYLLIAAAAYVAWGQPQAVARYGWNLVTFTFNFRRLDHDFVGHPAITPLWSLCVEEQFYLLWPLVILLGRRGTRVATCALLVVLGPAIRAALVVGLQDGVRDAGAIADTIYWLPVSHLDAFASGALVSLWLDGQPRRGALRWERGIHLAAALLLVVAGVLNLASLLRTDAAGVSLRTLTSLGYPLAGSANLQPVWCYTLLNLAAATTILLLCRSDGLPWLARQLRRPLLQRVGEVSYGMYLVHWGIGYTVQHVVGDAPWTRVLTFVPYFALVFGVAWISYHGFEKRLLELRAGLPGVAPLRTPAGD